MICFTGKVEQQTDPFAFDTHLFDPSGDDKPLVFGGAVSSSMDDTQTHQAMAWEELNPVRAGEAVFRHPPE